MALHYPPLTRNVGCFVTIAATLAVCALLGVTGGPRVLASYVGPVGGADATKVASSAGQMTDQAVAPSDRPSGQQVDAPHRLWSVPGRQSRR